MYSFSQRADTRCVDEPFYAYYLTQNPGIYRVYRDQVLSAQESDPKNVLAALVSSKDEVIFVKHIAKHAQGIDVASIEGHHVLLYRNPVASLSSFAAKSRDGTVGPALTLEELGFPQLVSIKSQLGSRVLCVDFDELMRNPENALRRVCEHCEIDFDGNMLEWEPGPKKCDGVWAPYWYSSVHASTCFRRPSATKRFDETYYDLLREAYPFYQCLKRRREDKPILVWVGRPGETGCLVPRSYASVSVFDSATQGGDACWEGFRVYNNRVFQLDTHLDRLMASAKSLAFRQCHTRTEIKEALFATLRANGMLDGTHVRLTLTRGEKSTSSMNPNFNVYGTTLLIVPERKPVAGGPTTYDNSGGVKLITSTQRRNPPQCLDSKIHHNNLLNNILAKIQANSAGASDAIMLDLGGYVSETNATNLFAVRDGVVVTPTHDHCLPGCTRGLVIHRICPMLGLACEERNVSLSEFHTADEAFMTGTMGGLTPIVEIDARQIGDDATTVPGPITQRIQQAFADLIENDLTLSSEPIDD